MTEKQPIDQLNNNYLKICSYVGLFSLKHAQS